MDHVVAVFDVDGTLTVRDCVVPFTRRVAGIPRLIFGCCRRIGAVSKALVARNRDALKELFIEIAFTGKNVNEVEQQGVEFADKVFHTWMRSDVARRFRWHQAEGHVVLLVSASLDAYLMPLGDLLEADAVLCTELETSDGVYTGRLVGPNCRAAHKETRIRQWCSESGVDLDAIHYAYGDSRGDTEMMALASHPIFVKDIEIEEVPA